ncbi:hypothetical protein [Neisseria iguanae]|uniref:hypothetical protein n=1 Tax=Neisseria iguanae TaxID=90242 RepID=UPI0011B2520C|nr:hypothetical protein [Neisseria iguanae]
MPACFPVVIPVDNPLDEAPNIYGVWRLSDVGGYSPYDPNAIFTINIAMTVLVLRRNALRYRVDMVWVAIMC